MAIKINFNVSNNPECPTLILAKRDGSKLGMLNNTEIHLKGCLNEPDEMQIKIYKELDGVKCHLWDDITNFKLIWCKEWNLWFDITVEVNEKNPKNIVKDVSCVGLGASELSQLILYNVEINTDEDIAREEYDADNQTVLYRPDRPESSLLHRIMTDKAPHYTIEHVDSRIAGIQRTFSFDNVSIYDAFQEISEEIGCLFIVDCESDGNGDLMRKVSVYDLETYCNACGERGEFIDVCPKCGSHDLSDGYGEDTTIFISSDALGNEIQFTTDTDSVKNCFKLEGGDDLMTATVRNLNPNGSSYIWHVTEETRNDMSLELKNKLDAYDSLYEHYQKEREMSVSPALLTRYNQLVDKYADMYSKKASDDGKEDESKDKLEKITVPIKGYPALLETLYNAIDFSLYLESGLMPTYKMADTDAAKEAAKLTRANLSPVAMKDTTYISETVAKSAVLSMAKVLVDPRYKVEVASSSLSGKTWTGSFTVTNYSAEQDVASSATVSVEINDDEKTYLQRAIEKTLSNKDSTNVSISGLFKRDLADFKNEIKKYCLNSLAEFWQACQACIQVLDEQGVNENLTWGGENLREEVLDPYMEKLAAIEIEIHLREQEIWDISGGIEPTTDNSAYSTYKVKSYGVNDPNDEISNSLREELEAIRDEIQANLDFKGYVGETLWNEFCAYRREDEYKNDNYTGEGLNNAELFDKAREFLEAASKEIWKSAELQHSISTSLKNLLVIKQFTPIRDYFEVGNWLRVQVDDVVYKLRLLEYEVHYDDLADINVTFADVTKLKNGMAEFRGIIDSARSMATSYDSVKRQAGKGNESKNILDGWVRRGLDATNTYIMNDADNQDVVFDQSGGLFRRYDPIIDDYSNEQMKIINSTLAMTKDNWKTVSTAIGHFYYYDQANGNKLTSAYGVNAEVVVGELILGEALGIYNSGGTMTFNKNGLKIENDTNIVTINPNEDKLFRIQKKVVNGDLEDIFYANGVGDLEVIGKIIGGYLDIKKNGTEVIIDPEGLLGGKIFDISKDGNYIMSVDRDGNGYFNGRITGGCLNIEKNGTKVVIDPAKLLGGKIFDISRNGKPIMSVDGNGDGYFNGEIHANSGTIGGFGIDENSLYSKNGNLVLNDSGQIISRNSDDPVQSGPTVEIKQGSISIKESGESMQIVGSTFFCSQQARFDKSLKINKMLILDNEAYGIDARALRLLDNGNFIIGDLETEWDMNIHVYCRGEFQVRKAQEDGLLFGIVLKEVTQDDGSKVTRRFVRSPLIHDRTGSGDANVRVTDDGCMVRIASSSSRYKKNISTSLSDELNPDKLYSIDVVEYAYKHDYLDGDDERFGKTVIGFTAEDIEKNYPIAVDHNEDGSVESWNERYMIPPMLKLIQEQHEEIQTLQDRLDTVESKLEQVLKFVESQKASK